eukprot:gene25864-biopygen17860
MSRGGCSRPEIEA